MKNLTEYFYNLPNADETTFEEWLSVHTVISSSIEEYNLEDGYVITSNVIAVEDKFYRFDISNSFDGFDYEIEIRTNSIVEVEPNTVSITIYKKVK